MCLNLSKNENHFQVFSAGKISGGFLPRRSPGTSCENEPQDGMLRNVRPPAASPRPPSSSIRPSFPIRFFLPHPPSFPSPGPPHRSARCLTFQRRCPFPRCRALRPRPSSHTAILLLPSSFSPGRQFSPIHCRPVPDIPLPARSFPGIPSLHASPIPERPRPLPAGEPPRPHPLPPRPRDEPRNFHPDSRPPETPRPRKGDLPRQAILYTVAQ